MSHYCVPCNYSTNRLNNYKQHITTVKHEQSINNIESKTKGILNENLSSENCALKKINEEQCKKIHELIQTIKCLQEQKDEFKNFAKEIINKPTTTVIKNNNTVNVVNVMSPEFINFGKFKEQLLTVFNTELIVKGDKAMAEAIMNTFLIDGQGRSKIVCTDISRQNFQYKDEKSNTMITDPELSNIMSELREASKNVYQKDIHNELWDAAKINTNKDGVKEIDIPYLEKLNKRGKFQSKKVVKHIARKTYKKASNSSDVNKSLQSITREEWMNKK